MHIKILANVKNFRLYGTQDVRLNADTLIPYLLHYLADEYTGFDEYIDVDDIEYCNIIDGSVDDTALIAAAEKWNKELIGKSKELINSAKDFVKGKASVLEYIDGSFKGNKYSDEPQRAITALRKGLLLLSNKIEYGVPMIVMEMDQAWFKCSLFISDGTLKNIKVSPTNYAIIETELF